LTPRKRVRLASGVGPSIGRDFRTPRAIALPIGDATIDVAAQNCLFNSFEPHDLERALAEMRTDG
jgi:hypothetical protein